MSTNEKTQWLKIQTDRPLILSLFASAFWVLITHAYMLFQDAFSHDSLNAYYADAVENAWKMKLGRILKPIYQYLTRGEIAVPWLIGLLVILWVGLAVYFVSEMFRLKSAVQIILLAGILASNLTLSATIATYIYDADANMLAMLLAVIAAYLWYRKTGFLWSMVSGILLCLSMCLYQGLAAVSVVLMMAACIFDFINGRSFKKVFFRGIRAILILLSGMIMYMVALAICNVITGISYEGDTSNSLSVMAGLNFQSVRTGLGVAYEEFGNKLIQATKFAYGEKISVLLHVLLLLAVIIRQIPVAMYTRKMNNLSVAGILILLLPLGMNFVSVLNGGTLHYIMIYACWLIYLIVLLADAKGARITNCLQAGCRYAILIMLAVVLWGNVRTANTMYLQKDMEQEATLSLMTRVAHDMQLTEGYVHGETPLAFIGTSKAVQTAPGFEQYMKITGMDNQGYAIRTDRSVRSSYYPCEKYIHGVLGMPAKMCDNDTWITLISDAYIKEMPCYPEAGSIQFVNDILVVKMGEP